MQAERLRAWWSERQGLNSVSSLSSAENLSIRGWARSVGGCNPYLTLYARSHISRAVVDAEIAQLNIHELPSARGCTYVLPANDFGLGLLVGEPFRKAELRVAASLGVTDSEIDKLCSAVVDALHNKVLSPEEIRTVTGDASRSLGELGKKKGLTSTLPVALGKLQALGEIRRVPIDGRLDQQRYKYTAWQPNPRQNVSFDTEEVLTELARKYFKWAGPATQWEFQWFSGLTVGTAKKAIAPLNLVPIAPNSERLLLPEDLDEFLEFKRPTDPIYKFVSSIDGICLLRRDVKSLLLEEDQDRPVSTSNGLKSIGALGDLPSNAILDRGRLIGLWEFDPTVNELIWTTFIPRNEALKSAATEIETYVRDQLGDARSFSLDSPKSRAPLLAALREAATCEPH